MTAISWSLAHNSDALDFYYSGFGDEDYHQQKHSLCALGAAGSRFDQSGKSIHDLLISELCEISSLNRIVDTPSECTVCIPASNGFIQKTIIAANSELLSVEDDSLLSRLDSGRATTH